MNGGTGAPGDAVSQSSICTISGARKRDADVGGERFERIDDGHAAEGVEVHLGDGGLCARDDQDAGVQHARADGDRLVDRVFARQRDEAEAIRAAHPASSSTSAMRASAASASGGIA